MKEKEIKQKKDKHSLMSNDASIRKPQKLFSTNKKFNIHEKCKIINYVS
ncbi:hypothetical protein [Buchnera aphidicola]|nr:hypothetical protein [Buchnera aphidicola]